MPFLFDALRRERKYKLRETSDVFIINIISLYLPIHGSHVYTEMK